MTDHSYGAPPGQIPLIENSEAKSRLDELFAEARLYRTSEEYMALLEFVARMRAFAAFNAMLLHLQKPGLSYAATVKDWRQRFGRSPKAEARPLLILKPFCPVVLVYDVLDTEGRELPLDAFSFVATGELLNHKLEHFNRRLAESKINCRSVDAGDQDAGFIRRTTNLRREGGASQYDIGINQNHPPAVQFSTLAHELAHLVLGHLGPDSGLKISGRLTLNHSQREIEAESVAYILCGRLGIEVRSQTYLSSFLDPQGGDHPDVYVVMKAVTHVEKLLGMDPGAGD